mmetsp:Transcript_20708/g.26805  ORF Transcript_20708/g.26805 Transcript_20708/m.26805 type:complete len:190 (+) Transcript_20708:60-629(+)
MARILLGLFCLFGISTALVAPPVTTKVAGRSAIVSRASTVDPYPLLSQTLQEVEDKQLLSKIAKLGLLTKLEKAGVKLSDVEPLLIWAEDNGLVGAAGELQDDLLPLLPALISLAPLGLPLLAAAISIPSIVFFALAAASLAGAYVLVGSIPDDSITNVALQTFLAIPLVTLFPILFGGLGIASSKLSA